MEAMSMTQDVLEGAERCKRGIKPPVPFGYESLLTEDQRHRIDTCRRFGWELAFIRRPLFSDPMVIMVDGNARQHWLITDNGELEAFQQMRTA